ncbi:MAG: hypothetical protein V3575_06690 [Candidatus Absconditabacteria bacterium]
MDTNTMFVWLAGIVGFIIVMILVVKTLKIVKGVDGSVSIEVKRKVDQLQIQLEQIKSSHEVTLKEFEAKLIEIKSMVDIEKEKTAQGKDTVITNSINNNEELKIDIKGDNKKIDDSIHNNKGCKIKL